MFYVVSKAISLLKLQRPDGIPWELQEGISAKGVGAWMEVKLVFTFFQYNLESESI